MATISGSSPRFQIPYAKGTDPVVDGNDAMEAGTLKIDTLLIPTGRQGTVLWNSGAASVSMRLFVNRASTTTSAAGAAAFSYNGFAAVTAVIIVVNNTAAVTRVDTASMSATGGTFYVYRATDGSAYANTAIDFVALVVGLAA